jgi:hypothetical protein
VQDITEVQAAWVAGFYEGEGTIHLGGKTGGYKQLMTQISQCGEEVPEPLVRVCDWTGLGKVFGPYQNNSGFARRSLLQPKWIWQTTGERDVTAFIALIRPWLSERRIKQADGVLEAWVEYRSTLRYPNKGYRKPVKT